MSAESTCPYCQRVCKSAGGLKQHISQTNECREAQMRQAGASQSGIHNARLGYQAAQNYDSQFGATRRSTRTRKRATNPINPIANHMDPPPDDIPNPDADAPNPGPDPYDMVANDAELLAEGYDGGEDNTFDFVQDTDDEEEPTESSADDASIAEGKPPNTEMLSKFREYCDTHPHSFLPLTKVHYAQ